MEKFWFTRTPKSDARRIRTSASECGSFKPQLKFMQLTSSAATGPPLTADRDALFYLRSRGIPLGKAKSVELRLARGYQQD
jgi:hypothetical protein